MTLDEIMTELYECGEKGMVSEFNKILLFLLKEKINLDSGKTNELYHHLLGFSQDLTARDRSKIKVKIVNCAMNLEIYENIVRGY